MTTLTRAEVQIGTNLSRLKAGLASARSTLRRTGRQMRRMANRIGRAIGAAFAVAGSAAVKFAGDFQEEMTRLETLVGLSAESVSQLRQQILQLGPAVGRSPAELARAMFAITSGGARGAEAMEILEQAAKASAVGLGNVEQIGRTATAALQAFGDQGLSATAAIDQMVATVRAGNLQARDLSGSLGRVMGIASTLGVRFADMNAFIATFTRLGVSAEESATSLRAILQGLTGANKQAAEAFTRLGIPLEDVRRTIREDGLVQGLQMMIRATDGNVEALTEIVPNIRALAGFLGTAGAQAEQFAEVQADVRNSLGLTNEGFKRTTRNLNFVRDQIIQTVKVIGIRLAQDAMGDLREFGATVQRQSSRMLAFGRVAKESVMFAASSFRSGLGVIRLFLQDLGERIGALSAAVDLLFRGEFTAAAEAAKDVVGGVSEETKSQFEDLQEQAETTRSRFQELREEIERLRNTPATALGGLTGAGGDGTGAGEDQQGQQAFGMGFSMQGLGQTFQRQIQNIVRLRQTLREALSSLPNFTAAVDESGDEANRNRSVFRGLSDILSQVAGFADNLAAKLLRLANSILNAISQISSAGGVGGVLSGIATGLGGFVGLFAHGGSIGRGEWGIAGEAGPEVVRGPAEVEPIRSGGGMGVIDASQLTPMGQLAARMAMEDPTLQRLFTAGVESARTRGAF